MQLRILADEGAVDAALRVHPAVAHLPPLRQIRLALRQAQVAQHNLSQMLVLHHQGDLIENAGVEVLQHMVRADIAEQGELVADVLRQGVVGAAHEHVRPQADALQLADAAFYCKKDCFTRYGGFDPSIGSAADFELMLRFIEKNRVSTAYIDRNMVFMRTGGSSTAGLRAILRNTRQNRQAFRKNSLPCPWHYGGTRLLSKAGTTGNPVRYFFQTR